MDEIPPIIKISFRARGYDESERRELLAATTPFMETKLNPVDLPEAGGSFDIWAHIDLTNWFVQGLIVSVAWDAIKATLAAFTKWSRSFAQRNVYRADPEIGCFSFDLGQFVLSFTHVRNAENPIIYTLHPDQVEAIPHVLRNVLATIDYVKMPSNVTSIRIPLFHRDRHPQDDDHTGRFWEVKFSTNKEYLWDQVSGEFIEMPSPH